MLPLEGHLDTQEDHAQGQSIDHRFLVFFFDTPAYQEADQAAACNGGHIHKGPASNHPALLRP